MNIAVPVSVLQSQLGISQAHNCATHFPVDFFLNDAEQRETSAD